MQPWGLMIVTFAASVHPDVEERGILGRPQIVANAVVWAATGWVIEQQ
jgi:hypothetical protein